MGISAKRNRIDEYLPVLAYEDGFFTLEPNSLGFAFICSPLTGGDDRLMARFNSLLNLTWPAETILQFCLWAGPDLSPERIILPGSDDLPEALQEIRASRVEFLRRGSEVPLDRSGLMLRDINVIITARLPMNDQFPADKDFQAGRELQNSALETLKSCGFSPRIMTPEDYIRIMETILNWSPDAVWRRSPASQYDPNRLIREQLLDYNISLKRFDGHLELGDKVVKVLSPKQFPPMTYFGLSQHFLIDPLTGNRGIRENVLITANVYFPDTEERRPKLERGRQFVTQQVIGPLKNMAPRLVRKKESFDILFDSMDEGNRVIQWMLTMNLFCSPGNAPGATANAKTFWGETGCLLLEDSKITLPLFLNCLPFGAEKERVVELKRYKTMTTQHVLPFLPVFGGWQGTPTPVMQFVGRDGQLMLFDFFDSTTNFNAVIAAQSGSGKSFLTNEIITQYLSVGGRCWVIDIGRSYEKMAGHLHGTFMSFSADSQICLNPFSIVQDYAEEADILVDLISTMAAPTEKLSDLQTSRLQEVLKDLWESEAQGLTIDILARVLKEDEDSRVRDVGTQLFAFTTHGEYGRFFNGQNNVDFQGSMIVIELEELRGRKQLQQVVLLQLIYQIQQEMYLGERDRRKLVIIDEAWDLLTHGNIGKFIEHGYRRFRKYGGAAVVITQSLNDLYASPCGQAIAENSAFKILLGQAPETIAQVEKEGRLKLGDYGVQLLKTLHTIPGHYSELCFITQEGFGVVRLYVEDLKRVLFSTNAEDVHLFKQLQNQGMGLREAAHYILAQREGLAA